MPTAGSDGRTPRRTHGPTAATVPGADAAAEAIVGPKSKEQKRLEAEARNRSYRATKERKERLGAVDAELAESQRRHDELVERMAQPEFYTDREAFDAALAEYTALKKRIPQLEEEWMTLSEDIERLAADGEE